MYECMYVCVYLHMYMYIHNFDLFNDDLYIKAY